MSTTMPDMSQPGAQAPQPLPPSAAPAPGPHSRLLAMIQGLAVGVGAFASSAATQGREGGPADVQAFQRNQQEGQLRSQESQIATQTAQRQQQEGDLRMQVMRGNMAVNQFQLEQARLMAPPALQKEYNDIAEQKTAFFEKMSQATGLPLLGVAYMANHGTQQVMDAMTDTAKQNGTTVHDVDWSHTQTDGGPGNGGEVKGIDIAKFGDTKIPPDLAASAILPVQHRIDMAAAVVGADNPVVKGAQQALDRLSIGLKQGMPIGAYSLQAGTLSAQVGNAMSVKQATLAAQKEQAETTEQQQKADPAFQVQQAGAKAGAEAKATLPFVGQKAAAEAAAKQPYELGLKAAEAPIAEGVAGNEKARNIITDKYVNPYVTRLNDVQELQSSLTEAADGNVAASRAVLLKLLGIAAPGGGKTRISPEALRELGGMGSAGQKWFGSIKDALTGDKWTAGMIADMRAFAQDQASLAQRQMRMGVHTTNVVYHTKVDPDEVVQAVQSELNFNLQSGDSPSGAVGKSQSIGSKYGPPVQK